MILVSFLFLAMVSCKSGVDARKSKSSKSDMTAKLTGETIRLDSVVFEENELMKVLSGSGDVIAYYDRLENKNYAVKGIKIFDENKIEKYILLPSVNTMDGTVTINIKDLETEKRGTVVYTVSLSGMKIKNNVAVDFFGKQYKYEKHTDMKGMSVSVKTNIFSNDDLVVYQNADYTMNGANVSELTAQNEFYATNTFDVAVFSLIIQLESEVNNEEAKKNRGVF